MSEVIGMFFPTKHGEGGHRQAWVRSKARVPLGVTEGSRSVQGDRQALWVNEMDARTGEWVGVEGGMSGSVSR